MANAPTVQTLDQIMASLQPGYAAQQGIIGQQIANTDANYKAQSLALDAAKTQGFNQINTQATGKGNTFSGIPVDEQANYLSTTYLPGVQQAQAKQNADKLTLAGQMAALNTDQRNQALGIQSKQQSDLNSWNMQERQIQASAAEAAANRAAQAREAAANRAAQIAAANAANRYAESQAEASKTALANLTNDTYNFLKDRQGKDQHVSPATWQEARKKWVAGGGDSSSFTATFSGFVNSGYNTYKADYGIFS